jgi:hypothetical protein
VDEIVAAIVLVVVAGLLYLLPAVPGCLPIWYFGHKRAQFRWWELIVLIVPFVIWICFFLVSKDKSLGNLVEAPILGGAIAIAALIRVFIGRHLNRNLVAVSLITGQSILAVLLGTMFPEVPFQWFH